MKKNDLTDDFVKLLVSSHNRLYGYIYSLTGKVDQAEDILQETNKKLWEIRDQYDHNRDFIPWACTVAYNQVRAARSKTKRERLIFQDDEVLHAIAGKQIERINGMAQRAEALEICIERLPPRHKSLVNNFYTTGLSMEEIGKAVKKSAGTIAVALHRIRQNLAECIRKQTV